MRHEEEIEERERQFPAMAGAAFAAARAGALAAGLSVVETRDAILREVFSGTTHQAIKAIEPPALVVKGSRLRIRR